MPGAGQALNAAIAIGPHVLDMFLAAVLGTLVLMAVVAAITVLRGCVRRRHDTVRNHATGTIAAALLVAGGLRLLSLPVSVLQFLLAAPLGSFPSDVVTVLGDLMLAVAGVVLLLTGRGCGAVRWALLLPPFAGLLTGIRLGLPFAGGFWIDLLPDVAVGVAGLLILTSHAELASSAWGGRRAAAQIGGPATALALTLVVLLAWPTSVAGTRGAGEPVIGPVRVVTASTHLVLPLDSYRQSFLDRDLEIRVENTLIRVCAARRGVSARAADLLPSPTRDSNSSLPGLIDAQQAAITGYWSPPAPESVGGVQSTHGLRVLTRCVSAARTRLGDDGSAQQFVWETTFIALARTDADSRVQRLQAAWSRCMQRQGFAYPTPMAVALTQAVVFPTPNDTRAASASVSCERVTNLPGLRAAVLAAYEQRAIAEHVAQLNSARLALLAQKRTANATLRGTSAR